MGIRPTLYFGVALSNLEPDPDTYQPVGWPKDWQNIPIHLPTQQQVDDARAVSKADYSNEATWDYSMYLLTVRTCLERSEGEPVHTRIYYDPEFGVPDVALYTVDQADYAAHYLYALTYLHTKYRQAGFWELPQIDPDTDCSEDAHWWRLAQKGRTVPYPRIVEHYQHAIDVGQNYMGYRKYAWPFYSEAYWLFTEVIGLTGIRRDDFKLGILWTWG